MLRIAQVSDLHITETEGLHHDIDVRQHFLAVLTAIKRQDPDLLILSGDLAAVDGEPGAYAWLRQQLSGLTFPYQIMMGNHDRLAELTNVFIEHQQYIHHDSLYYRLDYPHANQPLSLLFIDSSPQHLSQPQLDWLQQQDETLDNALLFIHHPPYLAKSRFMDEKHRLINWQQSWSLLKSLSSIKHIFCGHYHTEKTMCIDDKMLYLTPSSMLQIDTRTTEFAVNHAHPGWRWIEWDGQQLYSHCEYILEN